jgi:two-component system CheB/CheR fusion protein
MAKKKARRGAARPTRGRSAKASKPVEPAPNAVAPAMPAQPFAIVGIGMSAGGLEAYSQLLESLPAQPKFAMVLIPHLAPHHHSTLPELLAERGRMPVVQATDMMPVEPNKLYVIPPDALMELGGGVLRLLPRPTEQHIALPIDFFLNSLAAVQADRAVAVILSGTGSDGTLGIRFVKAMGWRSSSSADTPGHTSSRRPATRTSAC